MHTIHTRTETDEIKPNTDVAQYKRSQLMMFPLNRRAEPSTQAPALYVRLSIYIQVPMAHERAGMAGRVRRNWAGCVAAGPASYVAFVGLCCTQCAAGDHIRGCMYRPKNTRTVCMYVVRNPLCCATKAPASSPFILTSEHYISPGRQRD